MGNSLGVYSYFYSQSYDQLFYTLSPNTRLEFIADSNLFVETTSSDAFEYAYAINQSYGYDYSNGSSSNNYYAEVYADFYDSKAVSELKSLNVYIDNILPQESNGFLTNYANVYGYTKAATLEVPVPAALPLMASALGVFGIARRRNKAKASLKI